MKRILSALLALLILTCVLAPAVFAAPGDEEKEDAPAVYGDVDGDGEVTAADARLVLRAAVELEPIEEDDPVFYFVDIDADGALTAADARLVLRAAVELEDLADYYPLDEETAVELFFKAQEVAQTWLDPRSNAWKLDKERHVTRLGITYYAMPEAPCKSYGELLAVLRPVFDPEVFSDFIEKNYQPYDNMLYAAEREATLRVPKAATVKVVESVKGSCTLWATAGYGDGHPVEIEYTLKKTSAGWVFDAPFILIPDFGKVYNPKYFED